MSLEGIQLEIGDSALPLASVGGSTGISSGGSAIVSAAGAFRERHGTDPARGAEVETQMEPNPDAQRVALHSFGAQFAEAHVHADAGEIRVSRMLGLFDVGRIVNPQTAHSQLIGEMTMGLSMALHEEGVVDPRFRRVVNQDFAGYHIAANDDINEIDAVWLCEPDPHANPWEPGASARSASSARQQRSPMPSTTPPAAAYARCRSHSTSFSETRPALIACGQP